MSLKLLYVWLAFVLFQSLKGGTILNYVRLSVEDKMLLLAEHNKYRRMVEPPATNMQEMIWDPELAQLSQGYSRVCEFQHSSGLKTSKFSSIGENLYLRSVTGIPNRDVILFGVKGWYDEFTDYIYESNTCYGVCGHYTQMVWANTYALGCGITACNNIYTFDQGTILVCSYGPPGNYIGRHPYLAGTSCSECGEGSACEDKLCRDPNKVSNFSSSSKWVIALFIIIAVVLVIGLVVFVVVKRNVIINFLYRKSDRDSTISNDFF